MKPAMAIILGSFEKEQVTPIKINQDEQSDFQKLYEDALEYAEVL